MTRAPCGVLIWMWLVPATPTTHFVQLAHAILYRGARIAVVGKRFLILLVNGLILFCLALAWFRKTISQTRCLMAK